MWPSRVGRSLNATVPVPFEALIGHQPTVLTRRPGGRLRRLKAPQIADLLEQASRQEQTELLDPWGSKSRPTPPDLVICMFSSRA